MSTNIGVLEADNTVTVVNICGVRVTIIWTKDLICGQATWGKRPFSPEDKDIFRLRGRLYAFSNMRQKGAKCTAWVQYTNPLDVEELTVTAS